MNPTTSTPRWTRWLLAASTLALAWLWMMVVHELGHVLGAWLTGGTLTRVVLHPLALSRTDVSPNPSPLLVTWAGPVIGIALPLLAWAIMQSLRLPAWFVARFMAGFCLIANGAYLAIGSFEGIGDAGDMLRLGSPHWVLIVFGVVTVPAGLGMWHGLAKWFGFGREKTEVSSRTAILVTVLLFLTASIEVLCAATPQAAGSLSETTPATWASSDPGSSLSPPADARAKAPAQAAPVPRR